MVVYPLNRGFKGRDLTNRNAPARPNNVRYAPGPLGKPGGAIRFLGKKTSFVHFPNKNGAIDTRNSITILVWIYPEGKPGPIFNYHPGGWGVHLWLTSPTTLFARFTKRRGRVFTRSLSSVSVIPRQWQVVGASYDQNTGVASLWRNGRRVRTANIGKIQLATNYPARMGAKMGDRRYFRGRVSCLQVYKVALSSQQMKKAAKACANKGEYIKSMSNFLTNL